MEALATRAPVSSGVVAIPHTIHQTWKTAELPDRFMAFARSWRVHHPRWSWRLWSDADLRAFVATHEPAFLATYDAYVHPICRVDAARYALMRHVGGVYADLDFECLAPLDALLANRELVIGVEPASHLALDAVRERGIARLPSPALLASRPGHPFWECVFECLRESAHATDPLDATGPFLLARALARYRGGPRVALVDARLLHPVDKFASADGSLFDLERWMAATDGALAVHHWAGTWFEAESDGNAAALGSAPCEVFDHGTFVHEHAIELVAGPHAEAGELPLVSALMVTRDRPALAARAIAAFRAQTWPARELVIVDDGNDALARHVAALGDPRIRHLHLRDDGTTLGELRNRALDEARGQFVCQWDDDDLCDPARISAQMQALAMTGAEACFLPRWLIWWPALQRLALSNTRLWEGSMLARRERVVRYAALRRGEDTPVAQHAFASGRSVMLHAPRLYLYTVHDANTCDVPHFERMWEAATPRWQGRDYARAMQALGNRLPLAMLAAAAPAG